MYSYDQTIRLPGLPAIGKKSSVALLHRLGLSKLLAIDINKDLTKPSVPYLGGIGLSSKWAPPLLV